MLYINVTPYVKKYVEARLGHPIILDGSNTIVILLQLMLFKAGTSFERPQLQKIPIVNVAIAPPYDYRYLYKRGIPTSKMDLINELFEKLFQEDLFAFVSASPRKQKTAIEEFCTLHNIEIESDISTDAILKIYYRHKKANQDKIPCSICPLLPPLKTQNLSGASNQHIPAGQSAL